MSKAEGLPNGALRYFFGSAKMTQTKARKEYVFTPSTHEEEIEKIEDVLKSIVIDSEKGEDGTIQQLTKKMGLALTSSAMHEKKLLKREEIYQRAFDRFKTKQCEYVKAQNRMHAAKTKMYDRIAKNNASKAIADDCKEQIRQIAWRRETMNALFTGDAFKQRAAMMAFTA